MAEFLYFLRAEKKFRVQSKDEVRSVTELLVEAIREQAPHGHFSVQRFLEFSYLLKTHGSISSSASFFASECVRMKYALRGAFLMQADTMAPAEEFSKQYLNEQVFSAWTNLQGLKRLASTCIENFVGTQIEWVEVGCSLLIDNGKMRVPLTVGMLRNMYEDLLQRARNQLKELDLEVAFEASRPWLPSEAVDDNKCNEPGAAKSTAYKCCCIYYVLFFTCMHALPCAWRCYFL